MKRRELLVILGVAAVAWPLSVQAQQQAKAWRVGFLAIPERPAALGSSRYGAFARGMRELGYVEGDNLVVEYRFADGKAERLSDLVAELLELKPDVLVVAGTPAVRAAQKATTRIPIVMGGASDPVGSGLIQSLALPGGNITGVSNLSIDLSPKLSYGQHLSDNFRRAATYVDKTVKGAKPADLPVEESTKPELVINLRTAEALGVTIPPEMLVLATEVIE